MKRFMALGDVQVRACAVLKQLVLVGNKDETLIMDVKQVMKEATARHSTNQELVARAGEVVASIQKSSVSATGNRVFGEGSVIPHQ